MYKYKLKEIKVGDVETQKGQKTTVTNIDPTTGGITWSVEDVAAFDTVYKTFDKLNQLIKDLESKDEAKSDLTVGSIAEKVKDLFNEYRTHVRKNYPEAFERIKMVREELSIKGKKVKRINKNNSNNPEDYTVEYEDGTSEPYVDTLEESVNEGKKWSSYEQRMVNQIKAAQREGRGMYTLPMKTQDFYRKHKDKFDESVNEGTFHGPREIAIYDGPDGETYIEKRGLGYYGYNNSFDFEAEDKAELKHKLNSWGYRLVAGSIDEGEGEGYLTPKAFDKNKKSTGANDIYYYKLGYKPVPKKIKGAGLEVKQLNEIDEFSNFQQNRINMFGDIEKILNSISPLLSNAKNETIKYYNENPGTYTIVYSTDMVESLLEDITQLLN